MKTLCFHVWVLAVACALSSCGYDDGTPYANTPTYECGSSYSRSRPCGTGTLCARSCSPLGMRCAACNCTPRNGAPLRVRTRTDRYEGVSRYPTTWGARETTTVTVTTCTWGWPRCASCGGPSTLAAHAHATPWHY